MENIFTAIQAISHLNNIKRTGPNLFAGVPFSALQSLAEHSYSVACLCLILGNKTEGVRLDKLLEYAITHDWAECITGDVPSASLSYRQMFEQSGHNIREIFKIAEGKAKAMIFSDAKLDNIELNEIEKEIFGFCDILARMLEIIELKQKGIKSGWFDKFFKVQIVILKKYKFSFVPDVIFNIEELYKKGYMENKYLSRATLEYWKDFVDLNKDNS